MIDTTFDNTDNAVQEVAAGRERLIYGGSDAVVVALVAAIWSAAVLLTSQFPDRGVPLSLWSAGLGLVAYLAAAGVLRIGTRRFFALDPSDDDEELIQGLSRLPLGIGLFFVSCGAGVPQWVKMPFLAALAHEAAAYCVRTWLRNRLDCGKA